MDIEKKITVADKELVAKIHTVSVGYINKVLANQRAKKNRGIFLITIKKVIAAREKFEAAILASRQKEIANMMASLSTEHNPK